MIGSSQCSSPAAESEIRYTAQRVGTAIHALDEAIERLDAKLGYVSSDIVKPGECVATDSPGYGSPLARDLQCCIEAIERLTDRVEATKSRLAL